MEVSISKKDVIWSYVVQFFNVGTGFLILPVVLNKLSTEEIALNYLFATISGLVALLDFGFSPQFGRNITYVFSGAQQLEKKGLSDNISDKINYHLLFCLITVAKKVYMVMSLIAMAFLLTIGTYYVYTVTDGFTVVENAVLVWVVYAISVFFNVYFNYYTSLLTGRGLQMEQKKALMASRILTIVLTYVLIFSGAGLLGVSIANLIAPFIARWMSYHYFYDKELKENLELQVATKDEIKELFAVIWYNAKKLGVNFLGGYGIVRFGLFIAGVYLPLREVSSYGLMMQLVTIIAGVSTTFFTTLFPKMTSQRVNKDFDALKRTLALSFNIYYLLFISGSLVLVLAGPPLLSFIGSNAELPSTPILCLFLLINLLENNHSSFGTYITTNNDVPFVKAGLISGGLISLGDILILQFTDLGLLGLILIQGTVQLCYNNWYWPRWVLMELQFPVKDFLILGFKETYSLISNTFTCKIKKM